jgi:hypothetical protein
MKHPYAPVPCKQIRVIAWPPNFMTRNPKAVICPTHAGLGTGGHLVEFATSEVLGTTIEEN